MEDKNGEPKKGGVNPRSALYALASSHAKEAIEVLVSMMKNASNEAVRMGAAKVLLAKAIPDLKAIEIQDENGNPMPFILNEYIITKDEFRRLLETRTIPGNTDASLAGTAPRLE